MAYGVISAAFTLGTFAPAVFADEVISGNGGGSSNTITVSNVSTCSVTQENKTSVGAILTAKASTGGNEASSNTGGDVTIDTGKADASVTLDVTGGDNTATDPCCCTQVVPPSDHKIQNNGGGSSNVITDTSLKTSSVSQKTKTKVRALLGGKARTGKNKANSNTGGTTEIKTDNATATTDLFVTGGSNNLP